MGFQIDSINELLWLNSRDVGFLLPESELLRWFDMMDAHWICPSGPENPDPRFPHAELTSGKCSNGFFDVLKLLRYVNLSDIFASQMRMKVVSEYGESALEADAAVGSPMAAVTFAHDFARVAGIPISVFTEKDPKNSKELIWNRDPMQEGTLFLQAEELITTMGTTEKGRIAILAKNSGAIVSPLVVTIVYRPEDFNMDTGGRKICALIRQEIQVFEPSDCPYCKAGSIRYRPKSHWAELNCRV
jgi:orotate phosphoribosyltransferase